MNAGSNPADPVTTIGGMKMPHYSIDPDDVWNVLRDGVIVATCETPSEARRYVEEHNGPPDVKITIGRVSVDELAKMMGMKGKP